MNNAPEQYQREADTGGFERMAMSSMNSSARSSIVNRTHRVVRERARTIAIQRSRARSLWAPLAICSALLVIICTAVWSVLDEYEVAPTGVPDSSDQFLVLVLWFFPVSMALLTMVWFRRTRKRSGSEAMQ
jgi:protein-S-isoprenylcysteine O-methyltransferase Ste14